MGIKLKTFEIILDRHQPVYTPGEVVTGQCIVFLEGQMNLSQLTIKLKGKAECKWTDAKTFIWSDGSGQSHTRTEPRGRHSTHKCVDLNYSPGAGILYINSSDLDSISYWILSKVYPTVLNPGQHNIGFNFQLPSRLIFQYKFIIFIEFFVTLVSNLPSSFEGAHGHIRYRVKAHIHKSEFFSFDEKIEQSITIESPPLVSIEELSVS